MAAKGGSPRHPPTACLTPSPAGWTVAGRCKVAPPSQHTSPWTTPAPAPWCSSGPGGWLAAATERGETHLRTKNMALVIALEPWAAPKDLEISPQDHWHRQRKSSQVNHVTNTLHCQENNPPPVKQTTCPRENQCPHTERTAKAVGLQDPLHWPLEVQSHQCWGMVMPMGHCTYRCWVW